MAIDVAPWLLRDYDPVGTYLKAFQTGAFISAEQTRLAEQQRQANMDYMAKQEAMQQNILKAQVELQMEKSYREQRMSLENAQLEETKRRNDLVAQQAAASLAERMQQNQMMQQLRTSTLEETKAHNIAMEQAQYAPKTHFGKGGSITTYNPITGEYEVVKEGTPETQDRLEKNRDWETKQRMTDALTDARKAKAVLEDSYAKKAAKAQAEKDLKDANARYEVGAQSLTNAPALKQAFVDNFTSEDAARASGHKSGDIVYIVGVGKVRLR